MSAYTARASNVYKRKAKPASPIVKRTNFTFHRCFIGIRGTFQYIFETSLRRFCQLRDLDLHISLLAATHFWGTLRTSERSSGCRQVPILRAAACLKWEPVYNLWRCPLPLDIPPVRIPP